MIVIKTKLKKIPQTCTQCKYSEASWENRVCTVSFSEGEPKSVPYEFIKDKKNWCYVKPSWCPLRELEEDK